MTKEEIAADRAVCDAATPGPWFHRHSYVDEKERKGELPSKTVHATSDSGDDVICRCEGGYGVEIAAFIAAARTRWPAALDRIEQLEKEVAELRESKRLYHERHLADMGKIIELVRQNADFRFRIADVERAAQSELLSRKAEK
jgi:hypothetical protein